MPLSRPFGSCKSDGNARHRFRAKIVFDRLDACQALRGAFGQRGLFGVLDPAPEPDIPIAHGHVDQNPLKFVLIQQQFRQFGAQLPILRSAGFVMLDDSAGQPVQQVGAADNADEFAVPEYRYTLDMATL